jgi:arginyl-tRNA--protein-N-Asp/Glu arginylyltransferase
MKLISEPARDFEMYVPEGIHYIEREETDILSQIYARGFLPYSGSKNLLNVFYNARSARVDLKNFELSSENRRIARKFDGTFSKEIHASAPPAEAYDFCLTYFAIRHGTSAMPRERLEVIFKQVTHTTVYRSGSQIVAYVVAIEDEAFGHYWYSFYDLALAKQSLGMWLMLDGIRDAKEGGKEYYYLGTVYGDKALYKTNFAPLEWWDGSAWSRDIPALKGLARS